MKIKVRKVTFATAEPETEAIEKAFESEKIEWNPIACINWPEFPCTPEVSFRIMHSESEIYIQYKVYQQGARAVYDFDGDSQPWTDDCVEFFTTPSPTCGKYFNLEMNCIGHGIFCYGPDRHHRFSCDGAAVSRIRRHALRSVKHDFELPSVRAKATYLYLDAIQQGLGSATCGPAPLEKYMIPENTPVTLKIRLKNN